MDQKKSAGVRMTWRSVFDIGSTIAMLALALIVVWQGRARLAGSPANSAMEVPLPSEPIPISASEVRGSSSATVAIIEYADFECPSCAQFTRETEPAVLKEYVETGKVMLVFKHFPLASHLGAGPAALAAWCAGRQGKFREMHDWLFRLRDLQESDLEAGGRETGLDMAEYHACRAGDEAARQVNADKAEGERLRVPGTPTFFVGKVNADRRVTVTRTFVGGKGIQEVRAIVESVLGT